MESTITTITALLLVMAHDASGDCGGYIDARLNPTGELTSPNYPNQYPAQTRCTWTIKAPNGERVELEWHDFDVTGSRDCSGDFVGVNLESSHHSDGHRLGRNSETFLRFCGSKAPDTLVSDGDTLILTFVSNAKGACRGFNATYRVKEDVLSCGERTDALEFTFTSPNYPKSLNDGSHQCTLTVDHGCDVMCQMRLDFEEFELQPPFWGDCLYDQFYAHGTKPLPVLCGRNDGVHMYIDVEGRSSTDLTFLLQEIEYYLYHCYDLYGTRDHYDFLHHDDDHHDDDHHDDDHHDDDHHEDDHHDDDHDEDDHHDDDYHDDHHDDDHHRRRRQVVPIPLINYNLEQQSFARGDLARQQVASSSMSSSSWYQMEGTVATTEERGDVTVALHNFIDAEIVTFPTRRAWKIRVTQIPCDCPKSRVPKAPEGCLQYYRGLTGEFKSFNFDGYGCYTEDRWCHFDDIQHVSDCDIRVGYTGHLNNLDYSVCIEPESGFCGIEYRQMGSEGFSMSNISDFGDSSLLPYAAAGDMGCMADYVWVPGVEGMGHGDATAERFCGTKLGNARKWATLTSYSKPFTLRAVTDADEFSVSSDYMNRGFHLAYSQIPCKMAG